MFVRNPMPCLCGYEGGGDLLPIHNMWIVVRAMLGTVIIFDIGVPRLVLFLFC